MVKPSYTTVYAQKLPRETVSLGIYWKLHEIEIQFENDEAPDLARYEESPKSITNLQNKKWCQQTSIQLSATVISVLN